MKLHKRCSLYCVHKVKVWLTHRRTDGTLEHYYMPSQANHIRKCCSPSCFESQAPWTTSDRNNSLDPGLIMDVSICEVELSVLTVSSRPRAKPISSASYWYRNISTRREAHLCPFFEDHEKRKHCRLVTQASWWSLLQCTCNSNQSVTSQNGPLTT